jgi:hypothetical protein
MPAQLYGESTIKMAEPALLYRDRLCGDDWRVEWTDEKGGVELAIFSGPDAYERTIRYADRQYRLFDEIDQPK